MKLKYILFENVDRLIDDQYEKYYDTGLELLKIKQWPKNVIELEAILIRNDSRGQGVGSKILSDLCNYANTKNQTIILVPDALNREVNQWSKHLSPDDVAKKIVSTTSNLIKFYSKFGFVKNEGKTLDQEMSLLQKAMGSEQLMYRRPE